MLDEKCIEPCPICSATVPTALKFATHKCKINRPLNRKEMNCIKLRRKTLYYSTKRALRKRLLTVKGKSSRTRDTDPNAEIPPPSKRHKVVESAGVEARIEGSNDIFTILQEMGSISPSFKDPVSSDSANLPHALYIESFPSSHIQRSFETTTGLDSTPDEMARIWSGPTSFNI